MSLPANLIVVTKDLLVAMFILTKTINIQN
jgi:hypothetical protein